MNDAIFLLHYSVGNLIDRGDQANANEHQVSLQFAGLTEMKTDIHSFAASDKETYR